MVRFRVSLSTHGGRMHVPTIVPGCYLQPIMSYVVR